RIAPREGSSSWPCTPPASVGAPSPTPSVRESLGTPQCFTLIEIIRGGVPNRGLSSRDSVPYSIEGNPMSLAKRFQQATAWEYSLIDRMRVRGHVMNMQNVCMLRMFYQQCRGVNWIEPQHLQRITQDFVQHVEAFAQKHKIPLITAKPG